MKFAKVYEVDDTQILIKLSLISRAGQHVEKLELQVFTHTEDGYEMSCTLAYESEAVEAFDIMDEEFAVEIRNALLSKYKSQKHTLQ